jgi:hypothetical protein
MRFKSIILKKGTPVFHGTAVDALFTDLEGPAWVAKAHAVAEHFAQIRGGSGSKHGGKFNRILQYEVTTPAKLILIRDRKDWFKLLDACGIDQSSWSPHRVASVAMDYLSRDYDGWLIPENYINGDDLLLFHPNDHLTYKSAHHLK